MGAESKMLKDYITDATKQKEAQQRFRETFSFLKDHEIKLFKIEAVDYRDGNYTGEVNDQKERHGWGEMYWKNGTVYGPGNIFIYSHGDRYVGQWLNNKQDGIGTFFSQTGAYVGDWKSGLQHGNGTALYKNGNKYVGQFRNGFKDGFGVFTVANGDQYSGFFKQGIKFGHGIETFHNGEKYVGEYKSGIQNGQGSSFYSSGGIKYKGDWINGMPHGFGTFFLPNGMPFKGEFEFGKLMSKPGTVSHSSADLYSQNTERPSEVPRFDSLILDQSPQQTFLLQQQQQQFQQQPSGAFSANTYNAFTTTQTTTTTTTGTTRRTPVGLATTFSNIISAFWPFG